MVCRCSFITQWAGYRQKMAQEATIAIFAVTLLAIQCGRDVWITNIQICFTCWNMYWGFIMLSGYSFAWITKMIKKQLDKCTSKKRLSDFFFRHLNPYFNFLMSLGPHAHQAFAFPLWMPELLAAEKLLKKPCLKPRIAQELGLSRVLKDSIGQNINLLWPLKCINAQTCQNTSSI